MRYIKIKQQQQADNGIIQYVLDESQQKWKLRE